jgi:hypothetical protein
MVKSLKKVGVNQIYYSDLMTYYENSLEERLKPDEKLLLLRLEVRY